MTELSRYSAVSTINHWVTALLVTAMLVLGFAASAAPDDPVEHYIMGIHISLGFFVLLFVVWRVGFRLYEGFPDTAGNTPVERWLAYLAHRAILVLLLLQVLTGPLYLFTEGECMDVFGWFAFCLPLESLSAIHEAMEWLHVVTGLFILPALLVLHVAGAVRHYLTSKRRETPASL